MRYAIWVITLISAPLYATPSISVITDTTTMVHGSTLTISGTNFTAYSTTTGTFDTFESGSFNSYWAATNNLVLPGSQQRNANSLVNVSTIMINGATDHANIRGSNTTSRSWYVSFWWKLDPTWVWGTSDFSGTHKWLSNIKMIRFWNPGAAAENMYMAYTGWNGTLIFITEGYSAPFIFTDFLHVGPARMTLGTWHNFRCQFVDSSAAGVADGSMKIFFDSSTILNITGQTFKDAENLNKRPQAVGFDNVWTCTEGTPDTGGCYPGPVWIDNTYVMDSIARVEICDQPTYTACTVAPEIQKINSWTATDINITYNLGSLGTTQYVYVVDNTGTPSAGFLINGPSGGGGGGGPNTPHSGISGNSGVKGKAILK